MALAGMSVMTCYRTFYLIYLDKGQVVGGFFVHRMTSSVWKSLRSSPSIETVPQDIWPVISTSLDEYQVPTKASTKVSTEVPSKVLTKITTKVP